MSFWDNHNIDSKTAILIQARTTSQRLPRKVLLPLSLEDQTKTILEWIYERLKKTLLSKIFFVIPEDDEDLIDFLEKRSIPFFCGPLEDVRKRYILAAEKLNVDIIIRATADNPFVEPLLVIPTIQELIEQDLDLFSFLGLPLGVSVEAFTLKALKKGQDKLNDLIYKEHVSLHIKKNPNLFRFKHKEYQPFIKYINKKNINILPRLTLDQEEDYEVFKNVYKKLKKDFSVFDVMELFVREPEMFIGNMHVQQRKF